MKTMALPQPASRQNRYRRSQHRTSGSEAAPLPHLGNAQREAAQVDPQFASKGANLASQPSTPRWLIGRTAPNQQVPAE